MKLLKLFLLNILILSAFSNIAFAGNKKSDIFIKANNLYKEKKYEQAITLYQQIESGGTKNGDLLYNIGNAYTKANKIGMAKVYYLRAEKYIPRDTDLQANLEYVNNKTLDKSEPTFMENIEDKITSINSFFRIDELLISFLILWTLIWILLITKRLNKFTLPSIFFNIIVILLSINALSLILKTNTINKSEAIVIVQEAEIKSGNDLSNVTLFKLHEGTNIKVLEKNDKWSKVQYGSDKRGWVQNSSIYNI